MSDALELAAVPKDIRVLELTREVCPGLRLLDFKADPADELIGASSIVYKIPLLTRATRILSSAVVPLV